MKKLLSIISILVLLLISSLTITAQEKNQYTGALLWKVSGNGLPQPSYILGTHHFYQVDFVDSIPELKNVIEDVDQVVGELLLKDVSALQARLQQAAIMSPDEAYKDLLSEEDFQVLDDGLKNMIGAGLAQFGQLKPGMLSMLYTITLYSKLYPQFNPMSHEAIDAYVQRVAAEDGKTVLGLETVDDQIYALFDAEPIKDQAESLVCSIRNIDGAKEQMDKLNDFYKSGDLEEMYNLSFNNPKELCKISPLQKSAILENRNNKWMEKLPNILNGKSSLIAVGALHLAGKEGLLYQLAQRGYKVEPVE